MQTCVAEIASGLFARIADGIRSVAWTAAVLAVIIAFGAPTSGCGSAASDFGTDGGTDAGLTFHVDISLTTGLIAFPNKYSGWSVGGGSATNFVGYPSAQGWTVGGGSATNFTALPLAGARAEVHRRTSSLSPVGSWEADQRPISLPIPVHR